MAPNWTRLIRFVAEEDGHVHLGQVDAGIDDVGVAAVEGVPISAKLIQGSMYDGVVTDTTMTVKQVGFCSFSGGGDTLLTGTRDYYH